MLGRAAQTDHRLPLRGPNGPLGGLEQFAPIGVSEPHRKMQADTQEDRPEREYDRSGDARGKQDRGDERRPERHRQAVTEEPCHGLPFDGSSHVGAIVSAPAGHIV